MTRGARGRNPCWSSDYQNTKNEGGRSMAKKVDLLAGLMSAAIAAVIAIIEVVTFAATAATSRPPGTGAKNPGVRLGPPGAGSPIAGLSKTSIAMFNADRQFALFMRFLAPPAPSADTPGGADSIAVGRNEFTRAGCLLCHTPELKTATTRSRPCAINGSSFVPICWCTTWGPSRPTASARRRPGQRVSGRATPWTRSPHLLFARRQHIRTWRRRSRRTGAEARAPESVRGQRGNRRLQYPARDVEPEPS